MLCFDHFVGNVVDTKIDFLGLFRSKMRNKLTLKLSNTFARLIYMWASDIENIFLFRWWRIVTNFQSQYIPKRYNLPLTQKRSRRRETSRSASRVGLQTYQLPRAATRTVTSGSKKWNVFLRVYIYLLTQQAALRRQVCRDTAYVCHRITFAFVNIVDKVWNRCVAIIYMVITFREGKRPFLPGM